MFLYKKEYINIIVRKDAFRIIIVIIIVVVIIITIINILLI